MLENRRRSEICAVINDKSQDRTAKHLCCDGLLHYKFFTQFAGERIFTARCYATAVLAMGLCLSVCVCLSQVRVLLKRLNVGSHKQHHTIAQGLYFSDAKDLREIRPGSPPTRAPNAGGVGENRRLL